MSAVLRKRLVGLVLAVLLAAIPVRSFAQPAPADAAIALIEEEAFAEAYALLLPLAEAGDPLAQLHLGNLYLGGLGVARNDAEGVRLHRLAAEAGLAEAQNALALDYMRGVGGLPRSPADAVTWLNLAVAQGFAPAQVSLGLLYATGEGVAQDFAAAMALFQDAAAQGSPEAAYQIGILHALGRGVPQSYVEAVAWMRVAADGGFAAAHFQLGVAYERGQGVEHDIHLAFFHFAVAYVLSGQGPEGPFFAAVNDMAQALTEPERQQGIAAAEGWVEAFYAAQAAAE